MITLIVNLITGCATGVTEIVRFVSTHFGPIAGAAILFWIGYLLKTTKN